MKHPVLQDLDANTIADIKKQYGEEQGTHLIENVLKPARAEIIRQEEEDAYYNGFVPDHWKDADDLLTTYDHLLISGGNRSGKTSYSSRKLVDVMVTTPKAKVVAFSMTNQSSVRDLQPSVYKYLPSEFKGKKKMGRVGNVSYTQKNGFTNASFVLPNGSQCFFHYYEQRSDILEGMEANLIFCDELVPASLVETAVYRLVTRKGKLIIAATPITGWTPVVNKFMAGAKPLETVESPLLPDSVNVPGCPVGTMPYRMECMDPSCAVIFFHTSMNPYNPYDQMERVLSGESSTQIKIRAYGWCDRTSNTWFPKFGKDHVISPDKIPTEGSNYFVADPHGARSWYCLWLRVCIVDGEERYFVYREYPDMPTYGEWAIGGDDMSGKTGPAQKPVGTGHTMYKELITELEGDEHIEERYIDPRAGGSKAMTDDGVTLIERMAYDEPAMYFTPAPGIHIEQGVGVINDALDYNIDDAVSSVNQPKLYISSECKNTIACMTEASAAGGEKNAFKDPIDCLRYLLTANPMHVTEKTWQAVGGGSY